MRIEKLSKGRKKVILTITILVLLVGIIYITNSRAKYRVTSNIQIVKGKVSYSLADLNVLALQVQESENSETYTPTDEVPTGYYEVNKDRSYCTIPGDNIEHKDIPMEYKDGKVSISITKKGTKCYVFLDIKIEPKDKILANSPVQGVLASAIDKYACDNNTNNSGHTSGNCTSQDKGIYETVDDYGKSYVFRGTVDNNWVHFADMYWRIIRINGNGTIRMIYAGTTKPSEGKWGNTGDNAAIKTSTGATTSTFNDFYNDNKYVGYMFGTQETGSPSSETTPSPSYEKAHENNYDSTIKEEIDKWYDGSSGIQAQYRDKIDVETGFCSDRQLSPEKHDSYLGAKDTGAGYNKTQTAYAPYHRTHNSSTIWGSPQKPTLKCGYDVDAGTTNKDAQKRDLFTGPGAQGTTDSDGNEISGNNKLKTPVGLITMDEVIMAGGLAGQNNYGYWLYTGQYYWTMSPFLFSSGFAYVFCVNSNGTLTSHYVNNAHGVRPVINIKADVTISGSGITDDPYIIEGAE